MVAEVGGPIAGQIRIFMNKKKPTVFISCGQYTEKEKELGKEIKELVEAHTSYEAYFSETVTSLDSLTNKIFGMLNKASGLIAVMHHRGNVSTPTPSGSIIRGSLWIEQEIAIAAFLRQILKRNIEPIFFIQEGIDLEGVRKYIHFNPIPFKEDKDIIDKLKLCLPSWQLDDSQPDPDSVGQSETGGMINTLLSELKFNVEVAKAKKAWTTYSINKRDIIASLEDAIGSVVPGKISDLYLNLESINSLINRVKPGCWSDQYYKKYYGDLVEPIKTGINLIKEK